MISSSGGLWDAYGLAGVLECHSSRLQRFKRLTHLALLLLLKECGIKTAVLYVRRLMCLCHMNIEALCAAPPVALSHSPSQMPLSCPVAPQAARS